MSFTIDLKMSTYAGDSLRIERHASLRIDEDQSMLRKISVSPDIDLNDLVESDNPHILTHTDQNVEVSYPLLEIIMKAVFEK